MVSKQFDFTRNSKGVFVQEEQLYLKRKRGVAIDLRFIVIDGRDETPVDESSR